MRIKLLCCLMVFLLAVPVAAKPPKGEYIAPSTATTDNTTFIDVNRILMFVTNHGNFGRDLSGVFGYDYGTWWPYAGDTAAISGNIGKAGDFSPNYASGLWVGAKVNNQIRVVVSEYSSEYVPGPMSGGSYLPDVGAFRVYKLHRDSLAANPNADYLNWPVEQGAPVDGDGNPEMIGDMMLWSVYNDADPGGHTNDAGETAPLGLEVRQTAFAFDRLGSLGDMVFVRYRVYNKGVNTLEECYFSIWFDPDLGTAGDDFVGCDTLTDLGFVYNSDNDDGQYGVGVPAMGCDFFQGPLKGREAGDTLIDGTPLPDGRMWGQIFPDSVNLGLSSFNKYINGTDPDNFDEVYSFMQGLTKQQVDYVYDGQVLKFVHTGDPVTGTGDLDIAPADRRWMQTTGPVTFAPGDSTEILIAVIVGKGSNNLTSVTVVKNLDVFAQKLYEEGFNPPEAPARPNVTLASLPNEITLSWDDTSEVSPGEFPFEGYSVWQGETPAGPWHLLATYDVVNEREDAVSPLIDTLFDPESGLLLPTVMRSVKNSGLQYHYRTTMDALTNTPLKDVTPYYFRVTAFSFGYFKQNGDAVPNGDRFLESDRVIQITPGAPVAGVHPQGNSMDVLPVTHAAGVSDGIVEPIILDPAALTGHQYRVTFGYDTTEVTEIVTSMEIVEGTDTCFFQQIPVYDPDSLPDQFIIIDYVWEPVLCAETTYTETPVTTEAEVPIWYLDDLNTNERLIDGWTNQADDEAYLAIDGFMLRVMGPRPGFKSFEVVANADGPLDPPEPGAMWFGDFPVPTEYDPDGYISERQQVYRDADGNHGQWGIHTADNGGSCAGGTRGSFDAFLGRVLRTDVSPPYGEKVGVNDFEIRFTGTYDDPEVGGSWVLEFSNEDNTFWAPFEIWHIGSGTPDDPSDDVRMLPRLIDDGDDNTFNLESWGCYTGTHGGDGEHSVSGADNDPFTDWLYWRYPMNNTPGDAGYQEYEDALRSGDLAGAEALAPFPDYEYMARMVLVSWNGGSEPPFVQDLPEQGTVFRMVTFKPNFPADTFVFTAPAPVLTATEVDLDAIKPVPNPFYLYSEYDPNPGSYAIRFHHLPAECTISIYNLGGELVRTIEKDDASTSIAIWDVLTENGLPVASGIYIYVVDAPGFGQKVGKMAVFVQQEVLDIY